MNSDIYQAVLDAMASGLRKAAHSYVQPTRQYYGFMEQKTKPEPMADEFAIVIKAEPMLRLLPGKKKKENYEALSAVANCVTLLCRDAVDSIKQDAKTMTVTVTLASGKVRLVERRGAAPKRIIISEREYDSDYFGLRDFALPTEAQTP